MKTTPRTDEGLRKFAESVLQNLPDNNGLTVDDLMNRPNLRARILKDYEASQALEEAKKLTREAAELAEKRANEEERRRTEAAREARLRALDAELATETAEKLAAVTALTNALPEELRKTQETTTVVLPPTLANVSLPKDSDIPTKISCDPDRLRALVLKLRTKVRRVNEEISKEVKPCRLHYLGNFKQDAEGLLKIAQDCLRDVYGVQPEGRQMVDEKLLDEVHDILVGLNEKHLLRKVLFIPVEHITTSEQEEAAFVRKTEQNRKTAEQNRKAAEKRDEWTNTVRQMILSTGAVDDAVATKIAKSITKKRYERNTDPLTTLKAWCKGQIEGGVHPETAKAILAYLEDKFLHMDQTAQA